MNVNRLKRRVVCDAYYLINILNFLCGKSLYFCSLSNILARKNLRFRISIYSSFSVRSYGTTSNTNVETLSECEERCRTTLYQSPLVKWSRVWMLGVIVGLSYSRKFSKFNFLRHTDSVWSSDEHCSWEWRPTTDHRLTRL